MYVCRFCSVQSVYKCAHYMCALGASVAFAVRTYLGMVQRGNGYHSAPICMCDGDSK